MERLNVGRTPMPLDKLPAAVEQRLDDVEPAQQELVHGDHVELLGLERLAVDVRHLVRVGDGDALVAVQEVGRALLGVLVGGARREHQRGICNAGVRCRS